MTDLAAIKAELRTLLEKATPGPWTLDEERMLGGSRDAWGDPDTMLYLVELSNPTHDAALIVAAVNALPLLLADTPSVEPAVEPLPEWACGVMGLCERRKGHEGTHSTSVDRAAGLRPSVEPAGLDVERLAEALKEYDAGRLRVPFAPSHVLSPDQSPSRFHRAWAKTLLDYAALPTQASDSPEKTT